MKLPFTLENKVIVITGASSGIGKQCAISCSKMGAKVVLIARNEERLKETFSLLVGEDHLFYSLDITEFTKIEPVIKDVVSKLGKISGFIHSAGIEMTKPLKVMKPEDYQKLFDLNVISGFEFARVITKKKFAGDILSLVFISSIMSVVANSCLTGYCATKGALISGIRSMAIELSAKGVRVNAVSPGYIQTEMMENAETNLSENEVTKLKENYLLGLGNPDDVANACVYLLSDASKWVTGTNLIVDGGYSAK